MKTLKKIRADVRRGRWLLALGLWRNTSLKCMLMVVVMISNANAQSDTVRYVKIPSGYMMVLKQGDDVFQKLEELARTEYIPSASFSGFGFVNIRFGYFDAAKKTYKPRQFDKVELTGMQGTIAWDDTGNVSIHAHGTVAGKNFKAYAGHILSATVSTGSVEIMVTVFDQKLHRRKDEKLGANVLVIGQ